MPLAPVDVYIIAFPDNAFNGEIVPAILENVGKGVITVLDVLFVVKDGDGTVSTLAIEDLGPAGAAYVELDIVQPGSLDHEDAAEVAEDLPANSSALLIAYENTWMRSLVGAFARANAVVIDQIRIPATVVNNVISA